MSYLVNLVLEGRSALVVGAGAIASRKIGDLLAAGARVTVVATRAGERVRALAAAGEVMLRERAYQTGDAAGAFLVVAATDDEELNARISADAQAAGILVNVVDRPALCTFTLAAVVRQGDLTLAVATDGRCPALASAIREELAARYGGEYAQVLDLCAGLRTEMIARGWSSPRIRAAIAEAYGAGLADLIAAGRDAEVRQLLRERLGDEFPLSATPTR